MKTDFKQILNTKNKLWISWSKVVHQGDGIINLINPKFNGYVLSDCEPIPDSGTITLDLTYQYLLHIPQPYLIKLSWEDKYKQDKEEVLFKKMIIQDGFLGKLALLTDRDYLLLDCTDHTTEAENKGKTVVNYHAAAFNCNKIPYNFNG